MEITGYYPQRHVELTADAETINDALPEWFTAHPDAVIDSIDGVDVVGMCDVCSLPILVTDESRTQDSEGVCICGECNNGADMRSIDDLKVKADSFDAVWKVCVELGMKVLPPGVDVDGEFIPEEYAYQFGFIRGLAAKAALVDDAAQIVREYAARNPKHHFGPCEQDPCGAHAWLERFEKC